MYLPVTASGNNIILSNCYKVKICYCIVYMRKNIWGLRLTVTVKFVRSGPKCVNLLITMSQIRKVFCCMFSTVLQISIDKNV
jgi:hypothetical protein